jgi:hypothetical protein
MKSGVLPARLSSGHELEHRHSAVCLADMLSAAVGPCISFPGTMARRAKCDMLEPQ